MSLKNNMLVKVIAIIMAITFSFENILWANPEVFKGRGLPDSLQVPSPFSSIVNPQHAHKFLFQKYILCAVKQYGGLDNTKFRTYPKREDGLLIDLRFDQKEYDPKTGLTVLRECALSYGNNLRSAWKYDVVIDKEGSIVELRKHGKNKPAKDPSNAESAVPEITVVEKERTGPDKIGKKESPAAASSSTKHARRRTSRGGFKNGGFVRNETLIAVASVILIGFFILSIIYISQLQQLIDAGYVLGAITIVFSTPFTTALVILRFLCPARWYLHRLKSLNTKDIERYRKTYLYKNLSRGFLSSKATLIELALNGLENSEGTLLRRASAEILGKIGGKESVPALIECLSDKDNGVLKETIRALGRLGDKRAAKPLANMIVERLGNPLVCEETSDVCLEGIKVLRKINDKEALRILINFEKPLMSPYASIRKEAIKLFGDIGDKSEIEKLFNQLGDLHNMSTIRETLRKLGVSKEEIDRRYSKKLLELLENRGPDVFGWNFAITVSALGKLREKRAIERLLFDYLRFFNPNMKPRDKTGKLIKRVLSKLGVTKERRFEFAVEQLKNESKDIRESAFNYLVKFGGKKAIQYLFDAVSREENPVVCDAVVEWLKNTGDKRSVDILCGLLYYTVQDKSNLIPASAAKALSELGSYAVDAIPHLIRATEIDDAFLQIWAIVALGKIGLTNPGIDSLILKISQADPEDSYEVRVAALRALSNFIIPAQKPPPIQFKIEQTLIDAAIDSNDAVRYVARQALEELSKLTTELAIKSYVADLEDAISNSNASEAEACGLRAIRQLSEINEPRPEVINALLTALEQPFSQEVSFEAAFSMGIVNKLPADERKRVVERIIEMLKTDKFSSNQRTALEEINDSDARFYCNLWKNNTGAILAKPGLRAESLLPMLDFCENIAAGALRALEIMDDPIIVPYLLKKQFDIPITSTRASMHASTTSILVSMYLNTIVSVSLSNKVALTEDQWQVIEQRFSINDLMVKYMNNPEFFNSGTPAAKRVKKFLIQIDKELAELSREGISGGWEKIVAAIDGHVRKRLRLPEYRKDIPFSIRKTYKNISMLLTVVHDDLGFWLDALNQRKYKSEEILFSLKNIDAFFSFIREEKPLFDLVDEITREILDDYEDAALTPGAQNLIKIWVYNSAKEHGEDFGTKSYVIKEKVSMLIKENGIIKCEENSNPSGVKDNDLLGIELHTHTFFDNPEALQMWGIINFLMRVPGNIGEWGGIIHAEFEKPGFQFDKEILEIQTLPSHSAAVQFRTLPALEEAGDLNGFDFFPVIGPKGEKVNTIGLEEHISVSKIASSENTGEIINEAVRVSYATEENAELDAMLLADKSNRSVRPARVTEIGGYRDEFAGTIHYFVTKNKKLKQRTDLLHARALVIIKSLSDASRALNLKSLADRNPTEKKIAHIYRKFEVMFAMILDHRNELPIEEKEIRTLTLGCLDILNCALGNTAPRDEVLARIESAVYAVNDSTTDEGMPADKDEFFAYIEMASPVLTQGELEEVFENLPESYEARLRGSLEQSGLIITQALRKTDPRRRGAVYIPALIANIPVFLPVFIPAAIVIALINWFAKSGRFSGSADFVKKPMKIPETPVVIESNTVEAAARRITPKDINAGPQEDAPNSEASPRDETSEPALNEDRPKTSLFADDAGTEESDMEAFLHDIRDSEELTENFKEVILSTLPYGKKIGLFFNRRLSGFRGKHRTTVNGLKAFKERMKAKFPKLAKHMDNLVLDDFETKEEFLQKIKKHGLVLKNKENHLIFTFSPETERENLKGIETKARSVYIKEGKFSAEEYYYPLLDIVTISVVRAHVGYTANEIYAIFRDIGIDRAKLREEINIKEIKDDVPGAFLMFVLIPKAEVCDHQKRPGRYARALKFLRAA